MGQRRSGDVRYHFDFGNFTKGTNTFNLFSNLKFNNKKADNITARFGASTYADKVTSSSRVELNFDG